MEDDGFFDRVVSHVSADLLTMPDRRRDVSSGK